MSLEEGELLMKQPGASTTEALLDAYLRYKIMFQRTLL